MKLADYIKGARRGREAHDIEADAMRDPFLSDALDGFDAVSGDHLAAMERLAGRIERSAAGGRVAQRARARHLRERRIRVWSVAAAAVLLVGVIGGGILFFGDGLTGDTLRGDIAHETSNTGNGGGYGDWGEVAILPPVEVVEERMRDSIAREQREKRQREEQRHAERLREEALLAARQITVVPNDPPIEVEATDFSELDPAAGEIPGLGDDRLAMSLATDASIDTAPQAQAEASVSATRSLAGRVVDASTGEAIPGVVVQSDAAGTGAITDADGRFALPVSEGAKIVAQYLGYESTEVRADSTGEALVAMAPDSNSLDDVVVIGYGTQRRSASSAGTPKIRIRGVSAKAAADTVRDSSAGTGRVIRDFVKVMPERLIFGEDSVQTVEFRRFVASHVARHGVTEERVIVFFEVDDEGRPYDIRFFESSSPAAERTVRRLLRRGPDWPTGTGMKRIVVVL